MTFQYMIWKKGKRKEHFVFHQKSLRIVYPPSHQFYGKPCLMAVRLYEQTGWKLIDSGVWRGAYIDEYMEAMRAMYPKKLSQKTDTD